ncbi:GNAT family N-acetyltransferase [Lapidilactobacillus bayanensis]|uniref:GNAT family N-acetyltransferase n=1 Tax=Lapidilactobacillus bayanensis TaxID=2485998 RepID=UPI000F79222C|nr:GNAT family N-acetyltransferase [Lapidilactobacillus bayanensis]
MNIREARGSDAPDLQKVNAQELHYDYSLAGTSEMLNYILSKDWQKIYVAEVNNEFAGYVQVTEYLGTFGNKMVNIMGLAVRQEFQGFGVGKALMAQAEQWGHEINAEGVRLNSGEERTEAHQFYEHIGYQKSKKQYKFQKLFAKAGEEKEPNVK